MRSVKDPAGAIVHDTPVPAQPGGEFWGSDPIAAVLSGLDIPYIALVPGSSYRGLHDSIVNYLGNRAPQMVLVLHEENTVAIAHGYAKASGRMMAAAMHANIGLMRAVMAVYNAWCDRAPILMFGATGPWDAARRRPWIDWIHTSADQGAIVRNITKWDNQPGSVGAAVEAIMRAAQIARTAPQGPVYVNLEVAMQEEKIGALPPLPDIARYAAPPPVRPAPELVAAAARLLSGARNPLMLAGRCSRSLEGWNARVALAERLNLPVLTHIKLAAAFPTDHRLHAAPPGASLTPEAAKLVASADVILALDWLDLAGTLKQAHGTGPVAAKVINVSCDAHSHRGWSMDHQGLPPADVYLMCETDAAVPLLLEAAGPRTGGAKSYPPAPLPPAPAEAVSMRGIGIALEAATRGSDVCYTRFPLGWNGAYTHLRHPLDYIGHDGGAGVGSGPGMTVGAGLALKGSGRVPVAIMGDGDFLMGNTAVWTAAHYEIPCLMIVSNNRSFYNDERHQGRMARERGRPEENRWIGQRIGDPDIDIAGLARMQGAAGIGPVTDPAKVQSAIEEGLAAARAGKVCVIDARVLPGYDNRG
ncbi:MAG: thiamine pyrophosphate-binding protein [Betaproteobacteria bacterium]|nr:thiamine pyrophosphate-binding protein [Betaproteobacteria bacterium]